MVSIDFCLFLLLSVYFFWCLLISFDFHWSPWMSIDLFRFLLMSIDFYLLSFVYSFLLISIGFIHFYWFIMISIHFYDFQWCSRKIKGKRWKLLEINEHQGELTRIIGNQQESAESNWYKWKKKSGKPTEFFA